MSRNKVIALPERTFVFIKPDGVRRKLIGKIIKRFEQKGFEIKAICQMTVTPELAKKHYAEHLAKPFYPELESFLTSGPIVAMVLEGRDAVSAVRNLVGATDAAKAVPGSIRGIYSLSKSENVIHASDSPESAKREIQNFFG